jgi:hypothetical protein
LKLKIRKIIALILVTVIISFAFNAVFSVAHEIEEAGFTFPHNTSICFSDVETSSHCPSCPTENHPSSDHDHFSCDHHSYVSLAAQTDYRHPAPIAFSLLNRDAFQFVPEVFLSIDTPPHILS